MRRGRIHIWTDEMGTVNKVHGEHGTGEQETRREMYARKEIGPRSRTHILEIYTCEKDNQNAMGKG